jgi:hypothetical protein
LKPFARCNKEKRGVALVFPAGRCHIQSSIDGRLIVCALLLLALVRQICSRTPISFDKEYGRELAPGYERVSW